MGKVVNFTSKKDFKERAEAFQEFIRCIALADAYLAEAQKLQEEYKFCKELYKK